MGPKSLEKLEALGIRSIEALASISHAQMKASGVRGIFTLKTTAKEIVALEELKSGKSNS